LQNREVFTFFDPVIQTGKVNYDTAGALGAGERVWVLAKVEGEILVKGIDKVDKYLLLSSGHDGRTALQIRFTPVRVVCQNTLSMALDYGSDLFKIYHNPNMPRRIDTAQEAVKKILGYYDDIAKQFDRFASKQLDGKLLSTYLGTVFPFPKRKRGQSDRKYEDAVARINDLRQTGERLFVEGEGNNVPLIKSTLWAAYNGVTEMVDHHWGYQDRWQRLNWLWFGEGERTKHRAYDEAQKMFLGN
jgi:phage/plasmid-like protein (TIGR03299 family)